MIYKEMFKMGLKDVGKDNLIKNRSILEIFENIGAYHSDIAGYGVNDIMTTGVTWILLDWKIEVIKRPKYGQILNVHTWGRGMKKFYTYRDYEIYDENNELCVIGTSKWALVDIKQNKISKLDESIIQKYKPEERNVFNIEEVDKLREPIKYESSIIYTVNRKDIDLNKHVHNLYYLDLAYEALPEKVYSKRPFDKIRITYKKEIKFGDTILCKYANEFNKHIISIKSEDDKILHSIIELES